MLDSEKLLQILQCPDCCTGTLQRKGHTLKCDFCLKEFPINIKKNIPILISHQNSLFKINDYSNTSPLEKKQLLSKWGKIIPKASVNLASYRLLNKLRNLLNDKKSALILVVGGGKQRVWLDHALKTDNPQEIIYSDIDINADIDLFCDGHDLPFKDEVFDAVITTAVLEHVMYPERVAAEITRVLKNDGLIYSELPFMQQVHEGAYDFTRYTLSGHRRLFNQFKELDTGMVAGPGTALVWSIENFFLAFIRRSVLRKIAKVFVRFLFGWIKYFDYILINKPEAMDGASCTYFLGKKSKTITSDKEIITNYIGAKHLSHTS